MAILEELEGWIRGGRLEAGHRLPSIKAIQKMLGVGQRSVESAIQSLEKRGLVETRN
jgi:DNA-binding FadR family transcriptional regulator